MSERAAVLVVLAGSLTAGLGALGVSQSEPPHLGFDGVDGWLIVFAIGFSVMLGAIPFGLHTRFAGRTTDPERRWELALTAWGGIAATLAAAFLLLGIVAGFDPDSAAGAVALVGVGACLLVMGALVILVLGGG